jgi:hypothetical protein
VASQVTRKSARGFSAPNGTSTIAAHSARTYIAQRPGRGEEPVRHTAISRIGQDGRFCVAPRSPSSPHVPSPFSPHLSAAPALVTHILEGLPAEPARHAREPRHHPQVIPPPHALAHARTCHREHVRRTRCQQNAGVPHRIAGTRRGAYSHVQQLDIPPSSSDPLPPVKRTTPSTIPARKGSSFLFPPREKRCENAVWRTFIGEESVQCLGGEAASVRQELHAGHLIIMMMMTQPRVREIMVVMRFGNFMIISTSSSSSDIL